MRTLRKSEDRGGADHGWLHAKHSFSFADYRDPAHMGFRSLRVINQDIIEGGGGFPPHPHRDMEIITYVLQGAIAHKDSMGNMSRINRGEIQVMSAGKGVVHSEFNASDKERLELLQIWVLPDEAGLKPAYGQMPVDAALVTNRLGLLVGPVGRDDEHEGLSIRQNAYVYVAKLDSGESVEHDLRDGTRHAWIQVVSGEVDVSGIDGSTVLSPGDGLAVSREPTLKLTAKNAAELLLFDLA